MSNHKIPDAPAHPSDPTTSELPKHRRGGQELPDNVQDRPEQNAGYDQAVHGGATEEKIIDVVNDDDEDRDVEREREEDARGDADVESEEPQHRPH